MSNVIVKILKKILGRAENPAQAEMNFLLQQGLKVGKNFHNYSPYAFDSLFPFLISVGDNVTISSDVKILSHDASMKLATGKVKLGKVKIGNNCFIGHGAIILCNTQIGDHVIIGAGSVATGKIPANSVYAGNPAKFICTYDAYIAKHSNNDLPCLTKAGHSPQEIVEFFNRELKNTHGYIQEQ